MLARVRVLMCACPFESAGDGTMLYSIPSGSKLIGAAMLRLRSDNDHKHSGYSRMNDLLHPPAPPHSRLT